jgi:tripartite-type tricarboxylate transporter receptor subunit TctC
MPFLLKSLKAAALTVGVLAAVVPGAQAQSYPTKPIRMLVGFPPGGGLDYTTRLISSHMTKELGQPIVVENKPGVGGVIALTEVSRAAPDGYTLVVGNVGPMALAPHMMDRPPYDPTKAFTSLGQVLTTSFVFAVPATHPANSLSEFISWAKTKGGDVSFASGGAGSITHLNGELLNSVAGLKMLHVPYKGSAPAVTDLVAGRTHVMIDIGSVLKPMVLTGRLKALAVSSETRDPELPKVPTLRELGMQNLETSGFQGLIGPAGMPKDVVDKLYNALRKTLDNPEVQEKFAKAGTPVVKRNPEEFEAFVKAENARWIPLIKATGVKLQ